MEIRSVPQPVTRIDKAPVSAPRTHPVDVTPDVTIDRSRDAVDTGPERRQKRDRRRPGAEGKPIVERRISGNRRRRSVDITV